ncbi:MAG TPA: hypothetical protein VGC89_11795 [Pyrinomonadaceae bacterium]|jgi:hypothetical protein
MMKAAPALSIAAHDGEQAGAIDRAIALGERLIAAAESFAFQLDIGDVDLPPVTVGSEADQSHLRSVAPLYLASELELARLLPATEMLAGLYVSGAVSADVGAAAPLLAAFWHNRTERFSVPERQAFFARLFGESAGPVVASRGGGRNTNFESLMIDLAEALTGMAQGAGTGPDAARFFHLQTTASQLVVNLLPRSGGIATFAARDLLTAIKQAIEILKLPALQQALGARSVWGVVQNIVRLYLNERESDIGSHVTRGKAGMLMLAWLAESLPLLGSSTAQLVPAGDKAIGAAYTWMQASLALHEGHAAPVGQES